MSIISEFNKLAKLKGALNKQKRLQELSYQVGPLLREVCCLAYNPYWHWGYLGTDVKTVGALDFTSHSVKVLMTFNSDAIRQHLMMLNEDGQELTRRILNKDLRIGMGVKTLNKVWPDYIPVHDVMLAKTIDWNRVRYPCWATYKLDGVRAIYRKGRFYTRRGKPIIGLEVLQEELKGCHRVLDGELTIPGMAFYKASGALRSFDPCSTAVFHLIEVPDLKNYPNYITRLAVMKATAKENEHIEVVPSFLCHKEDHINFHFNKALDEGYEGLVVKPSEYEYVKTRSYSWMKLKAIFEEDLYVIDIFRGTGKYCNSLGGVVVDRKGVAVKVGSGFLDKDRDRYYRDPSLVIGRMSIIRHWGVTPDGSLRHPVIKGFRDDKA